MKRFSLFALVVMLLIPSLTFAGGNDAILKPIADQITALTPEQRAELVASMTLYMALNGEKDVLQAAFDKMASGFSSNAESTDAPEAAPVEKNTDSDALAVGSTSRKSPATLGQTAALEMNMYDEYTYTETIKLLDVKYSKDTEALFAQKFLIPQVADGQEIVACQFEISMGEQSDGKDREVNIWNTDFKTVYPDGKEADPMPNFADKVNFSLYASATDTIWVSFVRKVGEPVMITFEPTNKNKFDDTNAPKSKVWFLVE